ncbi:MAG: RNA polymerase factor sigma-32 [Myxococcota bacterium]|jgi:RNA polymerase sigma-32 factor|nr:RNA polymerase factor sigma-32 [Myxococcota bacterium]
MPKSSSTRYHADSDSSQRDSLKRYLADIRHYPVLDKDDEVDCARRAQAGDEAASTRLVSCNLRLVVKIALEYQSTRVSLLDLIQEGNMGLLQAVRKFDPERSIRLSTYAQFWIRAYILKFLMDNYRLVKVGTTQAQRKLFYNLRKEKERLAQQGITPSTERVAAELDVRERDVVEMETRLAARELSLDAPVNEDAGSLMDLISSSDAPADEQLDQRVLERHVGERLSAFRARLQGRDSEIWDRRLTADEPLTLQELGELFGVSRERARQLEARIVKNLGKYLEGDERIDPQNLPAVN